MHIAGLLGMPRRIYTYPADMGWNTVNLITSLGSFVFALGVLIFLFDLAWSYKRGSAAGDNPWDAPTLEWSIPSPPPPYNFATVPFVGSRHPLWENRLASERGDHAGSVLDEGYILDHGREALGTTALDGEPDIILKMPGDSYAPFLLGVFSTLVFAGMVASRMVVHGGDARRLCDLDDRVAMARAGPFATRAIPCTRCGRRNWLMQSMHSTQPARYPIGSAGERSSGWWGVWTMIATESALFGYLVFSYLYLAVAIGATLASGGPAQTRNRERQHRGFAVEQRVRVVL